MRIGQLAMQSGLSRDTLRFYEKRGIIRAHRSPNGYRDYSEQALFVIDYVKVARRLGFSLAEIEAELPALADGGISVDRIADVLRSKIAAVDTRIAELQHLRTDLASRLAAVCPILAGGSTTTPL